MSMVKIFTPLMMVLALTGCNKAEQKTQAPAQTGSAATTTTTSNLSAEDHKDARKDMMKEWKKANKVMGGMVKDPTSFNAATFKDAAAKLNQDAWVHFPADAKGGEAKDTIWTDTAGFQAEVDKYKKAVTALNTAAGTATNVDGVKAQFAEVGSSCKSCHEKFKED